MKLNLRTLRFAADAMRMLNGAILSVNGLYTIVGVGRLRAVEINLRSTTALRLVDLEGLPSNNTMGPVNARPLLEVRKNRSEQTREEIPGRFLTKRVPTGNMSKMFKQVLSPPTHVKERAYP